MENQVNTPLQLSIAESDYSYALPTELTDLAKIQTEIPRIAKNNTVITKIMDAVKQIPTTHDLIIGDARNLSFLPDNSIHLIVTSPPYWTLKSYNEHENQLGAITDFDAFINELNKVWKHCYRVLVPGGRLVCVVGDVCLSRRKNNGRHRVVPLHASIQNQCRIIGYDNLAPVIWHKISNAMFESSKKGNGFFGKPYEPNAIIKNDIEYILMERKPGGYRQPNEAARLLSVISAENHRLWFQSIWTGIGGASTRKHPAPFPEEIAERLIRMFSFVGDYVLDPFMGTGTTCISAAKWGRNSIGVEVDSEYFNIALDRISNTGQNLFSNINMRAHKI